MLKRNLYFAPRKVKEKSYTSCVLPILEYASTCWSSTSKKCQNMLEMVHHNAAKFVSNCYPKKGNYDIFSITKVLKSLNWESLKERQNQSRLIMAYKIIHGQVILESEMLPMTESRQPERKCNGLKIESQYQLKEPHSMLDITSNTFFYAVPRLWNNTVTSSQAEAPSTDSFKKYFKKH